MKNIQLKALISLIFDLVKLAEDAIAKKSILFMLMDLKEVIVNVPIVIQGMEQLDDEIEDLQKPENQADIMEFIKKEIEASGAPEQIQEVIIIVLKIIQNNANDIPALIKAIRN